MSPTHLYWASYEFHSEPRYRLLIEGGTTSLAPDEVRIVSRAGTVLASAATVPAAGEVLRFCAASGTFGAARATLIVSESLFDGFLVSSSLYEVQIRIGPDWYTAQLTEVCAATE